jgi:hypothetical protein
MNLDPGNEDEWDTFSRWLPLPYRVAAIMVIGKLENTARVQDVSRIHPFRQRLKLTVFCLIRGMGLGLQFTVPVDCEHCT